MLIYIKAAVLLHIAKYYYQYYCYLDLHCCACTSYCIDHFLLHHCTTLISQSLMHLQGNTVDYDVTYDSDNQPVGDKELFAIMRGAMKILNFDSDDEENIYKVMALVLHLGNVIFGGNIITTTVTRGWFAITLI